MKMIISISFLLSSLYYSSSHPILLMSLILTQALILCLIGWFKLKISWFSYILVLIFLGGLMIIFVYITSLASNEKITLTPYFFIMSSSVFIFLITFAVILKSWNHQFFFNPLVIPIKHFNVMYSYSSITLIVSSMIYLLLTLIVVVKISNKFEAPIKSVVF